MKGMFSANVEMKSYITAMKIISRDALPDSVAECLNSAADASQKQMKKNVSKDMTVRTPFTLKSIKQDRTARGNNIARMFSRVASVSPYLPIHDEGGTKEAKNKKIPIATDTARTGKNPKKKIARRFYINRIQFGDGRFFIGKPKGGGRRLGIYERTNKNKKLRMIRNLESSSVRIKKNNWFSGAIKKYGTSQFIAAQFKRAAQKRLKRFQ